MWLFINSRIFKLIFLIFFACNKIAYAKHKPKTLKLQAQSNEIACGREKILGNNSFYFWKQKYRDDPVPYATSGGSFCLNNITNELFIRKCNIITGEWYPPANLVRCAAFQKQHNKFCPEDLIEIPVDDKEFICLKLSNDAGAFNESFCYGSDTLFGDKTMDIAEMNAVIYFLSMQKRINRFWLPVHRATYNRYYNPFVVRLPGYKWGDIYESQDLLADKDCMSVDIVYQKSHFSFYTKVVNCNETLPMVCIFRKEFVAYSGCPQGFGALAHKPSECYGIEWEPELFPNDLRSLSIAEYVSKKNSLQHIFYSIDLGSDSFFLIGNFSDESNNNFDIEMNSEEELRLVPFGGERHALSYEHVTNLHRKSVEMILSENPQYGGLSLTIYNRNYIWRFSDHDNFGVKCFTNSESENIQWKAVKLKLLWQNTLETKAIFKIKEGNHDGYYWCEAHTIFDFSVVKTKSVAVIKQNRGYTFALLLNLPCKDVICRNLFSANIWKQLNKKAKNIVSDLKKQRKKLKQYEDWEISNIRLMDIVAVYKNGTVFQCLIHLTACLKSCELSEESEKNSEEFDSEQIDFSVQAAGQLKVLNLLADLTSSYRTEQSQTIRSTSSCFPEAFSMLNGEENFWQLTKYGQPSATVKLCLHKDGVPVTRMCLGDFLWGAFWDELDTFENKTSCWAPKQSNIITHQLQDIVAKQIMKKEPSKALKSVRNLLENNLKNIIPADFYYISRIMHATMKSILKDYNLKSSDVFSVEMARVYNCLMEVNKDIAKSSLILNSTNVLLEAFERLIDEDTIQVKGKSNNSNLSSRTFNNFSNVLRTHDGINVFQYEDIGVQVKVATNLLIFTIDPSVANITGVALYYKGDGTSFEENLAKTILQGSFENEYFQFIMSDQSVDELLYEENLQLATYIPRTLWDRLDEISQVANFSSKDFQSTHFVIKIYANDILFQEQEITQGSITNYTKKIVANKIISASIPGHDKDLPEMLPLLFKVPVNNAPTNNTEAICSYWNYGAWASDGLTFIARSEVDNNLILCGCTHLTPFAYLIGDSYKLAIDTNVVVIVRTHQQVLDLITMLGCSLSLFGTLGIFVTAATFQSWRQKASSKVLLQLSGAISLQMVLFCFVNTEKFSQHLMEYDIFSSCIAIGALLHYSVLVQFSWMIIIGYLQFKRYVQVFGNTRPKHFFKKSSIIGWGGPIIPVAMVLIFDRKSYIPNIDNMNGQAICYPSGFSLYLGVIFPITATIIANFIIFSIIVYNILRGPDGSLRHTEKRLALSQLRLYALLFFLLGFTWIFGLLATLKAGILFSYLFCLTATLQGFVIFIYFVILDPKTRRMWRVILINTCGLRESYEASISIKETI